MRKEDQEALRRGVDKMFGEDDKVDTLPSSIIPTKSKIFVIQDPVKRLNEAGSIIINVGRKRHQRPNVGTIVGVGFDAKEKWNIGDRVLLHPMEGFYKEMDGREYLVLDKLVPLGKFKKGIEVDANTFDEHAIKQVENEVDNKINELNIK